MAPQNRDSVNELEEPVGVDNTSAIDLKTVRAAIPRECFEISTLKGFAYYVQDLAIICGLYAARLYLLTPFFDGEYGTAASLAARFVWWNAVGFMLWAWFVVGHDCGHGTFSRNATVNAVMGRVAHVPILVPYHAWRQSHRIHHTYHNDLGRDKTWSPVTESHLSVWNATTWPGAIYRAIRYSPFMLLMFPYYLLAPGGNLTYGNHYNPFNNQLFPTASDKLQCVIDLVLNSTFVGTILYLALSQDDAWAGFVAAWDWYFVPYWINTAWLSLVTYLHHTSPESRFFRGPAWSFTKGAETTIDRNYGSLLNYLHHNIETHFVHHLFFTKIPHYHLVKATEAVKPVLGDTYVKDERNPLVTFVKELATCRFVPDAGTEVKFVKGRDAAKAKKA